MSVENGKLMSIPAVVTRAAGSLDNPEALVDAELLAPGPPTGRDLLVAVKAISVNPIDTKVRAAGGSSERVLGWDAVGTVLAVGEQVSLFRPGDEVFYAGSVDRPGSNAQQQLVDERLVALKPVSLSHAEAAALPLTSITAWETLFEKFGLDENSTGNLLVLGAAGGVGSILIQLAKALTKVQVIATASRPESVTWLKQLGADLILDHSAADFADQILAAAPGGVDYLFTPHSKDRLALFAEVVRPFGQIVAIDNPPDFDFAALREKSITWHWEWMFTRPRYGYDLLFHHRLLTRIAALVEAGQLRTTLQQTLTPINATNLRQAHQRLEAGHTVGKIVLTGW